MICDLLALRPISHITKKTLSYLHSTKIEQMTKTMVIFKRGAIFLCCIRCDPIPPQTSVQRLAHTRNVTTCCFAELACNTDETKLWLSPSAKQRRNLCSRLPPVYQDLSTRRDWPVKKVMRDLKQGRRRRRQ